MDAERDLTTTQTAKITIDAITMIGKSTKTQKIFHNFINLYQLVALVLNRYCFRPYECKFCQNRFFRKDVLRKHLKKCSKTGTKDELQMLSAHETHDRQNRYTQALPSVEQIISLEQAPDLRGSKVSSNYDSMDKPRATIRN